MSLTSHSAKKLSVLGAALLAGMLLAGCAAEVPSGPPPTAEHNTTGDLIPYEDIVVKHAFPWDEKKLEVVDDTHLRISYKTSPPLPCERTGAKVDETLETITVTLLHGEIPNAKKICDDENTISQMSSGTEYIMIETKSPIGNRKIIDGAPPRTPRK